MHRVYHSRIASLPPSKTCAITQQVASHPLNPETKCAEVMLPTLESPVMRSTKGSIGALISSVSSTKPAVQNTIMAFTTCGMAKRVLQSQYLRSVE